MDKNSISGRLFFLSVIIELQNVVEVPGIDNVRASLLKITIHSVSNLITLLSVVKLL